jgi:hypothetical protein
MTNSVPPPLIDCARVLHYAIVDDDVRRQANNVLVVGGRTLGAAPRCVIARNLVDEEILLLYCNEDWESIGASGSRDVGDAMARARGDYEGIDVKWRKAPYSDADFAAALAYAYRDERCSFCLRYCFQLGEVPMVRGDRAMICRGCIERLHDQILSFDADGAA